MADPTANLDDGTELLGLMRKFYPLLLEQAFGAASDTLGLTIAFDLENENVQRVLGQLAKLIVNVADTTRDEVRSLVGQAAQEGWSNAELAQRIREHSEIASTNRAELIARTETAHAFEAGSHLAYVESGVVAGTEWLLGPEPCELCEPLGGNVVALGDEFTGGVQHPPLHPRCTCATAPVLK